MSGPTQDIDFNGTQKIAANLIASTFCNSGTEAFLNAQADLMKGVETAMTQWLHRRQEGIEEAYRLMTRVRHSHDVTDIWKAQQDWAAGALQRLAADVTTYPALLASAGQRVGEATAQSVGEVAKEAKQQLVEAQQRMTDVVAPKPAPGRAGRAASEGARPSASEEAHPH
jgi:hypothetical protein